MGLSYDNARTIAIEKTKGSEKRVVNFTYDPLSRRIGKQLTMIKDGVTKTQVWSYVYDEDNVVVEIYTDENNITTKTFYTHGPGVDEHLAMERGGQIYYYYADGLGSISTITDAVQHVVQAYEYDSYGMVTPHANFRNSYAYTGREWDKETGLYYYRARYYDPMEGRFISKDPISFAGGDINLYGYVQQNQINMTDPLGLWSIGLEGYAGVGGGLTIGKNPGGSWFYNVKVGAGEGGGFQYDPKGTTPGYDEKCKYSKQNITFGVFMGANASLGPASAGYNMGAGALLQRGPDKIGDYNYNAPTLQFGKSFGARAGFAAGFELSGTGASR